jgi:hypothetical protein
MRLNGLGAEHSAGDLMLAETDGALEHMVNRKVNLCGGGRSYGESVTSE